MFIGQGVVLEMPFDHMFVSAGDETILVMWEERNHVDFVIDSKFIEQMAGNYFGLVFLERDQEQNLLLLSGDC